MASLPPSQVSTKEKAASIDSRRFAGGPASVADDPR